MKISVYIATSLDGFIARADGSLDWLDHDSGGEDYGYQAFIDSVDTLVMGRGTFDKVRAFDTWPYELPVVVLSGTLAAADLPEDLEGRVTFSAQEPEVVANDLAEAGVSHVYLDGGKVIQSFLRARLVDEITLTRIPILLGDGMPLFGDLAEDVRLEHLSTRAFESGLVQSTYRIRKDVP